MWLSLSEFLQKHTKRIEGLLWFLNGCWENSRLKMAILFCYSDKSLFQEMQLHNTTNNQQKSSFYIWVKIKREHSKCALKKKIIAPKKDYEAFNSHHTNTIYSGKAKNKEREKKKKLVFLKSCSKIGVTLNNVI